MNGNTTTLKGHEIVRSHLVVCALVLACGCGSLPTEPEPGSTKSVAPVEESLVELPAMEYMRIKMAQWRSTLITDEDVISSLNDVKSFSTSRSVLSQVDTHLAEIAAKAEREEK